MALHSGTIGDFFLGNPIIFVIITGALAIWIYGIVKQTQFFLKIYERFKWIRKNNIPFRADAYREVLKQYYPWVRWKRTKFCMNFMLQSPCVMDTFRHTLALPEIEYTQDELSVILMHEATHIVKWDNLWKKIAMVIITLNWFNPVMRLYVLELDKWSDIACDIDVVRRFFDGRPKQYFIALISARDKGVTDDLPPFVSQSDKEDSVKVRMRKMKAWQDNQPKRLMSFFLIFALIVGSTVPAFGISTAVVAGQNHFYKQTRNENVEESQNLSLQEFEISEDEVNTILKESISYFDEDLSKVTDVLTKFSITAPTNSIVRSQTFTKEAGDVILVSCYANSGSSIRLGIGRPDGSLLYINVNEMTTKTFTCEESGEYYIFIQNVGSTDEDISGYYVQ
jgi:beta-lactamase regulating signal transducer with metallopeptidase domain